MCAIGRALMARPKLLLLDEPSMGLAPILVETIFEIIVEINKQGTTVLLVEQNALMALPSPTAATCSRPGRSCSRTTPRRCARTTRCARRTSAKSESPHVRFAAQNPSESQALRHQRREGDHRASTDDAPSNRRDRAPRGGARGRVRLQQEERRGHHDRGHHHQRRHDHRRRARHEQQDRRGGAGADQVEGHAHGRDRRDVRARTSSSAPTGTPSIGMDADLAKALGSVMGLKVKVVNATFDSIIPGLAARQVRPRHVLVHRHEGAREDRRLRHLLLGRHVVLRQGQRRPDDQHARRPLRPLGRGREGNDAGRRRDEPEREVQERRARRREALVFPDQNGANLALVERPRARSAWPTRRSPPTRSSSRAASSS